MLQAVMVAPGKIEFREIDIPKLNPGEVLVKMKMIGVCGSDIHVYHGKHPFTSYPVVQGHEISAEVVETMGVDEKEFKTGDKVTVQPQVVCGECYPCKHGDYHICDNLKVMGFQVDGMAAEYVAVDYKKLIKLPDDMSFEEGALIEPLAVACHALGRSSLEIKDKKIVVIGAGPIGNLVAQTAKAKGALRVIISDVSKERLRLAEECGIDITVNPLEEDLKSVIYKEFGHDGADLILDCAGTQKTVRDIVNIARKGSEIIIVAVFPEEIYVNMGIVQDRELKLIGSLMYKREDYFEAIRLLADKKKYTSKIITDFFDFKDYKAAYEMIEEKKDSAMKVMIKFD
ncbi:MAG: alcohol dehydrogenase catalytic domain-containing protein [Eubacteriales bacterium]|nr:alcohol dehydrogenase catalytic domain-containing protein [Eubacteriales bacterium]